MHTVHVCYMHTHVYMHMYVYVHRYCTIGSLSNQKEVKGVFIKFNFKVKFLLNDPVTNDQIIKLKQIYA
jgi:hypothetical protein